MIFNHLPHPPKNISVHVLQSLSHFCWHNYLAVSCDLQNILSECMLISFQPWKLITITIITAAPSFDWTIQVLSSGIGLCIACITFLIEINTKRFQAKKKQEHKWFLSFVIALKLTYWIFASYLQSKALTKHLNLLNNMYTKEKYSTC